MRLAISFHYVWPSTLLFTRRDQCCHFWVYASVVYASNYLVRVSFILVSSSLALYHLLRHGRYIVLSGVVSSWGKYVCGAQDGHLRAVAFAESVSVDA